MTDTAVQSAVLAQTPGPAPSFTAHMGGEYAMENPTKSPVLICPCADIQSWSPLSLALQNIFKFLKR